MKTHFYTKDIIEICNNKHLTVDEIFEFISQKYPSAGKSSIYRNVEELCEIGKLKKISGASKKTFFEKIKAPHIHLIDEETGNIIDLDINLVPDLKLPIGFKANSYDIRIFGIFNK